MEHPLRIGVNPYTTGCEPGRYGLTDRAISRHLEPLKALHRVAVRAGILRDEPREVWLTPRWGRENFPKTIKHRKLYKKYTRLDHHFPYVPSGMTEYLRYHHRDNLDVEIWLCFTNRWLRLQEQPDGTRRYVVVNPLWREAQIRLLAAMRHWDETKDKRPDPKMITAASKAIASQLRPRAVT